MTQPPEKQNEIEKKYKILWDYHSEGFKFHSDNVGKDFEFDSVADAVEEAVKVNYCTPFLIVQVIDWKAVEIPKEARKDE